MNDFLERWKDQGYRLIETRCAAPFKERSYTCHILKHARTGDEMVVAFLCDMPAGAWARSSTCL